MTGGLVRLNLHEYELTRSTFFLDARHDIIKVLDRVRDSGGVSVATVLKKWTQEEVIKSTFSKWTGTRIKVATYTDLSWPEGYCEKCPVDILLPV